MKTRILPLLLFLVLLCVLLFQIAPAAFAEDAYSGSCGAEGDNLLWSYDPDTTTLTITGSGEMADYQNVTQQPWTSFRQSVTALSLPEGLTRIGTLAFASFRALTEVQIPDSVTELGQYSFFYTGLTAASIPAGISEVPQGAFAWCFNLSELTLSDGLTVIGPSAFEGCHLRKLRIPETVTTIGDSAFRECTGLKLIQVPASVTAIEDGAFYNIYDLVCLSILNENCELTGEIVTASDQLILWGHENSTASTYAADKSIPFGTIESLITGDCGTDLHWALDRTNGLLTVTGSGKMASVNSTNDVPWANYHWNIKTAVVEEDTTSLCFGAFYYCRNLQSISLPSTLTSIGSSAFYYCDKLSAVSLPAGVSFSWSGRQFQNCSALVRLVLPETLTEIPMYLCDGCTSLEQVNIPAACTRIETNAFNGCKLRQVQIPATISYIGTSAFAACRELTAFVVDGANPNYCAVDGVLFYKTVTRLLQYPAGRAGSYSPPDSVTAVESSAFAGSSVLTSVSLPESVSSLGASAFADCVCLESLSVYNRDCVFPSGNLMPAAATLCGYMESTAHTYADANGLSFQPLDGCDYGIHSYVLAEQQYRTDSTDGYRRFRCVYCGDEYDDVFPAWNSFPPLEDGACVPLPAELMQAGADGSAEQYPSEILGGIYFREGNQLYCYFPRSGELYLPYSFPENCKYYCSGNLLYALDGKRVIVYDLDQMDLDRIFSIQADYTVKAFGVDHEGRIFTAGRVEMATGDTLFAYDAQGVLLSQADMGQLNTVYWFDGFDAESGRVYMETWGYYGMIFPQYGGSHAFVNLSGRNVVSAVLENGSLRLEEYESYFSYDSDRTLRVQGLSFTLTQDGHRYNASLLDDGSLMCISNLTKERRILSPDDLTSYWALDYLPADDDGQGGSLPSIGTRCLCLPERGTILCYDGSCRLRDYDPDTHRETGSFQTAHPVYSLHRLGDWAAAIETDGSVFYLQMIDWSLPDELTVSASELTMQVGQELALPVQTGRVYEEHYLCVPEDPEIVFLAGKDTLVALAPGSTQVQVASGRGGPSISFTVHVTNRAQLPVSADTVSDTAPNNLGYQYLLNKYGQLILSYLYENADGTLERVFYDSTEGVVCSVHSAEGTELSRRSLEPELPLFGGYFRSADGRRYLVFGQNNPEESDECEVVRIVQYSADWQRLAACSVYGANTTVPFDYGSLRMEEAAGCLHVHTCHKAYVFIDGKHHQANLFFKIDESDMSLLESRHIMYNNDGGFVSHSFNQFVLTDCERVYRLDHGDGNPRSVFVQVCHADGLLVPYATRSVLPIQGSGDNATGVAVGAMAASDTEILIAGLSVDQSDSSSYNPNGQQNVFVISCSKDLSASEIVWLTDYTAADRVTPRSPHMVKLDRNQFLLLWEEYEGVSNTLSVAAQRVNADGTAASRKYRLPNMRLSDCAPILCANGTVCWYTSNGSSTTFYRIDPYHLRSWPGATLFGCPFLDVQDPGAYYFKPVYWAYNHEPRITSGVAAAEFGPDRSCTREQFMVFLWKLHGAPAPENASPFLDVKPSAYYADAVCWAAEQGITGGVSADRFGTGGVCTRAQAVTFLWRSAGSPEPETASNPFRDVSASSYYYKAVLWAAENQIAVGISESSFGPNLVCTRAQAVTMLYGLALLSE